MTSTDTPDSFRAARRVTLVCLLVSLLLGFASDGSYHDDDLTHYLMARWAGWYPEYLLHIWGRPGFTIPMAALAWISDRFTGWHAARILSSFVSAAGALIAARLAGRFGLRHIWLVVLLCYMQPLSLMLSYTTLTENWTGLYLIAAVALLSTDRAALASLVFSMALVTRHEAVIFLPLWWAALAGRPGQRTHKLLPGLLSLWAPLLHNLLFKVFFDEWPARIYLLPRGSTQYLPAGALAYLPHLLYAVTPVILVLACRAAPAFLKRDRWIVLAIPALFLFTHTVIKALGLFASGGYGRFMVAVAPFLAVLAAAGAEQFDLIESRRRTALVLLALIAIQLGIIVRPLRQKEEQRLCADIAGWMRAHHDDEPLFVTHPWIVYHLGLVENPRVHKGLKTLASMPAGTIIVWDNRYSESDYHGLTRRRMENDLQCRVIRQFAPMDDPSGFAVTVYRKQAPTRELHDLTPAYPPNLMEERKVELRSLYQREDVGSARK